eukprot:365396-Chlamydomonas_euryale.AAC.16
MSFDLSIKGGTSTPGGPSGAAPRCRRSRVWGHPTRAPSRGAPSAHRWGCPPRTHNPKMVSTMPRATTITIMQPVPSTDRINAHSNQVTRRTFHKAQCQGTHRIMSPGIRLPEASPTLAHLAVVAAPSSVGCAAQLRN